MACDSAEGQYQCGRNSDCRSSRAANNFADDAFVDEKCGEGRSFLANNLSEWAYFSVMTVHPGGAMGGQTLNPYGMQFIRWLQRREWCVNCSEFRSSSSRLRDFRLYSFSFKCQLSGGPEADHRRLSRTGVVPISIDLDTTGPMAVQWPMSSFCSML